VIYFTRPGTARDDEDDGQDEIFLPLTDSEGKVLPVHFLTCEEVTFMTFLIEDVVSDISNSF
jgi:hypothetical protein